MYYGDMNRKILFTIIIFIIGVSVLTWFKTNKPSGTNNEGEQIDERDKAGLMEKNAPHPLSIESLRNGEYPGSEITIEQTLDSGSNYSRYIASYKSEGLKIYALLTIPNGEKPETGWPVIIFNHGYIPPSQYQTTEGYISYVDYLARNGFVVFKIDLRGNGRSEGDPSGSYFSSAYTIDAISALKSLQKFEKVDPKRIGIWGHSNGGHIALAVLEITGKNYPTVLWAPVTAPFPYSVLYYTDDIEDHGKLLRKKLADFERDYDAESYSVQNYLDLITAPILLQQGTADDQVPAKWNQGLAKKLKNVEYVEYSGADHNLSLSWNRAMQDAVDFFKKSW